MKFAPIVPVEGLRVLERVGVGYHFVLGQELLRNKQYFNYYRALGRLGHFIIVDNGAAERDTPPFEAIVKAAQQIKASEIIMPDVLEDSQATQDALLNLANPGPYPGLRRMIVPQGRTVAEWLTCLDRQLCCLENAVASIGVAKHLEHNIQGGRARILSLFQEEYPTLARKVHIHLLGVWLDPFQEISAAAATCEVRGIDSGMPIAWAQRLRPLTPETDVTEHIALTWGEPFDLDLGRRNVWELVRYASEY